MAFTKFAYKGYSVALSEIANEVGIKKQSIYNYFSSKEDLFYQMIQKEVLKEYRYREELIQNMKASDINDLETFFKDMISSFESKKKLLFWKRLLLIEKASLKNKVEKLLIEIEKKFLVKMQPSFFALNHVTEDTTHEKVKNQMVFFFTLFYGALDGYMLYGELDNFSDYVDIIWSFFKENIKREYNTKKRGMLNE